VPEDLAQDRENVFPELDHLASLRPPELFYEARLGLLFLHEDIGQFVRFSCQFVLLLPVAWWQE
tara:strand:+ start:54 stop:245 length:192 start_codon:yes stop_codon:yes gene_type:complete